MFTNYFKIIVRNLRKNLGFTLIHLFGLSLGLTACLLIGLFIKHEISFDLFHQQAEQIYRFGVVEESKTGLRYSGGTPYPFAEAIRLDLPDMGLVTQVHHTDEAAVKTSDGKQLLIQNLLFADSNFFDVFSFDLLVGDSKDILGSPGKAIITQSIAQKIFGESEPIGQMIRFDNRVEVEISGLMPDMPTQTHLQASVIISLESLNDDFTGIPARNWGVTIGGATYVKLPESIDVAKFEIPLRAFADKYLNSHDSGFAHSIMLQRLTDIHFQPEVRSNAPVAPIQSKYLWIFACIGVLILISAVFNFVNLATAQAIKRRREVGVRKVLGATRTQISLQFLGEALILSCASGLIAAILAQLSLPYANQLLERNLDASFFADPANWLLLAGLPLLVGILSGAYPSLFLASYRPVRALASKVQNASFKNINLRRSLVLVQFAITILLLAGTLVVAKQVRYMRTKDLGFSQESVVMIDIPEQNQMERLRNELLRNPNISQVSFTLGAPTSVNNIGTSFHLKGEGEANAQRVSLKTVDHDYAEIFDLELAAGRWITESECRKSSANVVEEERTYHFIVNETLVNKLGFTNPQQAIGQELVTGINNIEAKIIGVVRDFHGRSLHNEIEPILFLHFPRLDYRAALKINMANAPTAIASAKSVWSNFFPEHLFTHKFLDESIALLYANERRIYKLFQFFAGLAMIIGGLGLLGLVSFMTELKTKEIGIRKVLGASLSNLLVLLTKEFLLLVFFSAAIAFPVGLYLMNNWLNNFAYRVSIGVGTLVISLLIALLITAISVGLQAFRAATLNPIKTLRDD